MVKREIVLISYLNSWTKTRLPLPLRRRSIILITIGANDIMKVVKDNFLGLTMAPFNREIVEYKERLRAIFHKMKERNPDVHIYLIGFYNPFEQNFGNIEELGIIRQIGTRLEKRLQKNLNTSATFQQRTFLFLPIPNY